MHHHLPHTLLLLTFKYNTLYRFNEYEEVEYQEVASVFKYNTLYRFNAIVGEYNKNFRAFKYNTLYRFNNI